MARTIHVAVGIDYLLGHTDEELGGWMIEAGAPMTAARAREVLAAMKAGGLEFVPPCPDHDGRGLCPGHETGD